MRYSSRKRTDNLIYAFKQRTAILLLPQLDPRINLNPPREFPQNTLEAPDFRRPHICEAGGSMPIQRGQGGIVEVYQSNLRNTTEGTKMSLETRRFFWKSSLAYDLATMTAAQLPTPPHPITATLAPRIFYIPSPKNV